MTKNIAFLSGGGYFHAESYDNARTVWYKPLNSKDKKVWEHPTIKPLDIIETLILNSSKEGETILDPFTGSGTTGVACVKHNRNFIGMEINEKYYNIAKQRIEAERSQLTFDF